MLQHSKVSSGQGRLIQIKLLLESNLLNQSQCTACGIAISHAPLISRAWFTNISEPMTTSVAAANQPVTSRFVSRRDYGAPQEDKNLTGSVKRANMEY